MIGLLEQIEMERKVHSYFPEWEVAHPWEVKAENVKMFIYYITHTSSKDL